MQPRRAQVKASLRFGFALFSASFLIAASPATAPTSQPTEHDSAIDSLLGMATTKPVAAATSQPTSQLTLQPEPQPAPTSPLVSKEQTDPDLRQGTILLSDGKSLAGQITTTAGKPLRTWDEDASEYRDVPLRLVKSIKGQIVWERDEPEWRFKESGSDIKINTGKTYPAREMTFIITLNDGKTIKGGIVAPLYFQPDQPDRAEQQTFILHKRDKGDVGKTLKELVYVDEVKFDEQK